MCYGERAPQNGVTRARARVTFARAAIFGNRDIAPCYAGREQILDREINDVSQLINLSVGGRRVYRSLNG